MSLKWRNSLLLDTNSNSREVGISDAAVWIGLVDTTTRYLEVTTQPLSQSCENLILLDFFSVTNYI